MPHWQAEGVRAVGHGQAKSIGSLCVRTVLTAAEKNGMGGEEFAARVGIPLGVILDPTARIDGSRYRRVLEQGHDLGLFSPASFEPAMLASERDPRDIYTDCCPYFWIARETTADAGTLLNLLITYKPVLLGDFDLISSRETDDRVRIIFTSEWPLPLSLQFPQVLWYSQPLRAFADGRQDSLDMRVGLAEPPPGQPVRAMREDLLGCRIHYDQATYWFEFNRAAQKAPNPRHSPLAHRIAIGHLQQALDDLKRRASFELRVEQALRKGLGGEVDPSAWRGTRLLSALCEEFGMSAWTLRRRLASEGASYRGLLTTVRLQVAKQLLAESEMPIRQIGARLGFDGPTSFSRFFRSLTGLPPNEFRSSRRGFPSASGTM